MSPRTVETFERWVMLGEATNRLEATVAVHPTKIPRRALIGDAAHAFSRTKAGILGAMNHVEETASAKRHTDRPHFEHIDPGKSTVDPGKRPILE